MSDQQDSDERSEFARVNRVVLSKKSEEYRQRRERNNAAVKKSRHKSKQKTLETQKRVEELKNENSKLERRMEVLSREFALMKDIFVPRQGLSQITQSNQQHPTLSIAKQVTIQQPVSNDRQSQYNAGQLDAMPSVQETSNENNNQQATNVLSIQTLSKLDD